MHLGFGVTVQYIFGTEKKKNVEHNIFVIYYEKSKHSTVNNSLTITLTVKS